MNLTGKILIAMPAMQDPRFASSVILVCAHSDQGAMGLVINKPTTDLRLRDMLEQLSITPETNMRNIPVYFGGPVEHGRGFILHEQSYCSDLSTLKVNAEFAMSSTIDVLEDLAQGRGPEHVILALGYAGWGPGQLEQELAQNAWLTTDSASDLVFETPDYNKWEAALARLGVSALTLSSEAGRA